LDESPQIITCPPSYPTLHDHKSHNFNKMQDIKRGLSYHNVDSLFYKVIGHFLNSLD